MIFKKLEAPVRYEAIGKLQQELLQQRPTKALLDPYWVEVYEKALDFALNEKRSVKSNFYDRLINDARRTIRRDRHGAPIFASFFIQSDEDEGYISSDDLFVDPEAPADILIQKNLMECVYKACAREHKLLFPVFNSMIHGYTVQETALDLNISMGLVKKLRSKASKTAERIFKS